jgi:tight adherence protein C
MGTLLLLGGLAAVFAGIALVVLSIAVLAEERTGATKSLASIAAISSLHPDARAQVEPPFGERVLVPMRQRAEQFARRFTPSERIERLQGKMALAGMPAQWTIDRVLATKTLAVFGLGAGTALIMLLLGKPLWALLFGAGGAVLGWFLPEIVLYQKAYNRSEQIRRSLPDTLDLLTVSVEAGLGFDAALANVARNSDGPLAEEFFRVLSEMQLGAGRMDALRGLGERTDVEDLRIFVNAMAQADAFGIPVAHVLRAQAKEMRIKAAQRAEETAMRIPVKMIFPLVLCILPALMTIVIGPAVVRIFDNFISQV